MTWILTPVLAALDAKTLRSAGEQDPPAWGWTLLTPLIYLAQRARRPAQHAAGWAPLVVGLVVGLLSLALVVPITESVVSANMVFDQEQVQNEVAADIESQTGLAVTVSCPANPDMSPGSSFDCIATGSDQRAFVRITIQDADGSYTWETR